jgi:hypothetical protein
MTEHTVTVEKTVSEEETVYTCDYCGLGDEAGEVVEYSSSEDDGNFPSFTNEPEDYDVPKLHFHVSCVPDVVASEDEATAMTLSNQYKRRTGTGLAFVFSNMSLVFVAITAALAWFSIQDTALINTLAGALAVIFGLLTLLGARKMADATIKEFST